MLRDPNQKGTERPSPNTDKGRGVRGGGGASPLTAMARLVAISHPYLGPSRMIRPAGSAGISEH